MDSTKQCSLKRKTALLIFSLCSFLLAPVLTLQAQVPHQPNLINPIPPSPNAAALGAYGNIPVSLYAGQANVSIPLFVINQDNFSMPITLNYNGGGVKVEEIAPYTGLNWTLNAGGVITRTVFGKEDFGVNGFQSTPYGIPDDLPSDPLGSLTESQHEMLWDFAKQNHDSEPDVFYFNFAGHSGKFVIDKSGIKHIIPHQKLQITGGNAGWTIVTEDGLEFQFGTREYHQNKQYTKTNSTETSAPMEYFISSWYLDKIKFPNSDKSIDFTYVSDGAQLTQWESGNFETKHFREFYSEAEKAIVSYSKNWVETVHLSSITFENGEVKFELGSERCDLIGDKVLQEITIKNASSEVIKRYAFKYTYNGWNDSDAETVDCDDFQGDDADLRLMLKEITEVDAGNLNKKPPYTFTYYEGSLPSRKSRSQDHWGYYNGSNNSTLIPDAILPGVDPERPLFTNFRTNRNPNFEYARIGSLKILEYPTGGSTSFEYEPHYVHPSEYMELPDKIIPREEGLTVDVKNVPTYKESDLFTVNKNAWGTLELTGFLNSTCEGCDYIRWHLWQRQPDGSFAMIWTGYDLTLAQGNGSVRLVKDGVYKFSHEILVNNTIYQQVLPYGYSLRILWTESNPTDPLTMAGGIRVSKITDYDPVANTKNVRTFEYKQSSDNEYSGFILSGPKFYVDYYTENEHDNGSFLVIKNYYILTSTNNYPLATTQGSYVGYSEVSEYMGVEDLAQKQNANGKITYKYYAPDQIKDPLPTRNNGIQGQEYVGFPYANVISQDWKRGLLKEQTIYSQESGVFKEVKKTNYSYSFVDKDNPNSNYSSVVGFKAGISTDFSINGEIVRFHPDGTKFKWGYYRYESGYPILNSIVEKTYDQNDLSKYIQKTTIYSYNPTNLQVAAEVFDTGTEKKTMVYTYPQDYEDQAGFIKELTDAHIINVPIEKVQYMADPDGNNIKILGGEINVYDNQGKGLLEKVKIFESNEPVLLSTFKFSNQENAGTLPSNSARFTFSPDTRYKDRITYSYDANTSKIKFIQTNKETKQYLWGYNNLLPVAEIINPGSGVSYHTSFEEDGIYFVDANGRNLSKTGEKVHQGNFTFPSTLSNTSNLRMSYWYHDGNKWVFSGELPYAATISTNYKLDEVRVFPIGTFMTTYTHRPLTGITSMTDANNVTTYYEYDAFGRLSLVRDDKGSIVKKYNYYYAER